jgi:hypothetical protein
MKIQTKIPVTYNSGIASQETSIVSGVLNMVGQDYYRDMYNFNFAYTNAEGVNINTTSSSFSLTKDEVNAFYDVIKSGVPTTMEYFETTQYIYYLGFKIEMAKTFGVTPNDIEIIL